MKRNLTAVSVVSIVLCVCSATSAESAGFEGGRNFGEQSRWAAMEEGIRLYVNAPGTMDAAKPTLLVVYATPNGSSIEETLGCAKGNGVGWKFDIQHVAAQVRRFRELDSRRNIVLAVTEAPGKSWPAFRQSRMDANEVIRRVLDEAAKGLVGGGIKTVLTGHSGGGSFIFGYVNGAATIPDSVERIVFLDANYAYSDEEKDRHGDKLLAWLSGDEERRLVVIAYDDREIVLDGKKVVGPQGGTFRATQRMLGRFRKDVEVKEGAAGSFNHFSALDGRAQFFVHPNRENRILHTALVGEMNGLLHGLTLRTNLEGKWGAFGGPRAYEKWVQPLPEKSRIASTRPTIPARPADAIGGSEFVRRVAGLSLAERETAILAELRRGNVPQFMQTFKPIRAAITSRIGQRIEATYFVSPDYLSIGGDDDFVRMPMTPRTAQAAAEMFGCVLITRKMSNDIFAQAQCKLDPRPLSVDREKVETFLEHHRLIDAQRRENDARLGLLVAGTKKDVVLSARLKDAPGRVAIFGWHFSDGRAIQPLSLVHRETYVDYSHGIRLASRAVVIGVQTRDIEEICGDIELSPLISDEGPIDVRQYVTRAATTRASP